MWAAQAKMINLHSDGTRKRGGAQIYGYVKLDM